MKYSSRFIIIILSVVFIAPLISLVIFISQLLHMYLIPFLPGTEPPIPMEFIYLFLILLPISISIQGIILFFMIYKNLKNIFNKSYFYITVWCLLASSSFNILFYSILSLPAIIFINFILIFVTLEHSLNLIFSLFIIIINILGYILLVFLMIYFINLSSNKILLSKVKTRNKSTYKTKFKTNFLLNSKILTLLLLILIDTIIFSIIFMFIQQFFFLWIKNSLSLLAVLFFLSLVYKELDKFFDSVKEDFEIFK